MVGSKKSKMSRRAWAALCGVLLCMVLLAGCGAGETGAGEADEPKGAERQETYEHWLTENGKMEELQKQVGTEYLTGVEENTIYMTIPADTTAGELAANTDLEEMMETAFGEGSENEAMMMEMIKGQIEESGITGIRQKVTFTDRDGVECYYVTYNATGYCGGGPLQGLQSAKSSSSSSISSGSNSASSSSSSSSSTSFTNEYGTPTTKCAHSGCSNFIASSGDTNCYTLHSNKCAECGKYIDEDATWCMECLTKAANSTSGSSSSSFTNEYGTPTTKCAHSGCSNFIASSGDTNCCTLHSNRCAECGKYIDEDATWCMDCLAKAANSVAGSGSSSGSSSSGSSSEKYPCMGKNDTCPNYTYDPYDFFCSSCDPDGDNKEG